MKSFIFRKAIQICLFLTIFVSPSFAAEKFSMTALWNTGDATSRGLLNSDSEVPHSSAILIDKGLNDDDLETIRGEGIQLSAKTGSVISYRSGVILWDEVDEKNHVNADTLTNQNISGQLSQRR